MVKKTGPYVGVTGFMSRGEVEKALALVPQESTRRLMVGVLLSSKTFAGIPNKWPGRYPKKDEVADIFVDDPRALNLIHYSTDNPETLFTQLMQITEIAGPHLDGFQLNIPWPDFSQLEAFRKKYPDKFLLLQIGNDAMRSIYSPNDIRFVIEVYLPVIDAILIDASCGKGQSLNAAMCRNYLHILRDFKTLGIGVAGGLGPNTLHLLDPLVGEFPNLSIDAEGRLRTPEPEGSLFFADVQTYLEDAFPILAGKELPGVKLRNCSLPYGIEEHARLYGRGVNMLRTAQFAQPRALLVGDTLATGDTVLSPPREGGTGGIWLHLTGGHNGHWVSVPARIPIALLPSTNGALKNDMG